MRLLRYGIGTVMLNFALEKQKLAANVWKRVTFEWIVWSHSPH
jgi:hypothetical protein